MQLETRRMSFLKMSSRTGTHQLGFEIQKQQVKNSSKLGKIVFFRWYLGHVCCKCRKKIVFRAVIF